MFGILVPTINLLASPDLVRSVAHSVFDLTDSNSRTRTDTPRDQIDEPPVSKPSVGMVTDILSRGKESLSIGDQKAITSQVLLKAETTALEIRAERLRQARFSFNSALALSIFGVVVVLTSLILLLQGFTSQGVAATVVGSACEATALIVFRLNKEANDRLDVINKDINVLVKARLVMDLIENISDHRSRDRVVAEALRAISQRE